MSSRDPIDAKEVPLGRWSGSQVLLAIAILCAIALLLDIRHLFSHDDHDAHHEPHVRFESWFNFFGFAAILATLGMAFLAKVAGNFLRRPEGYYDE